MVESGRRHMAAAMGEATEDTTKTRDIPLRAGTELRTLREAAGLLADADGVAAAEVVAPRYLRVRYDLHRVGLEILEDALSELGFPLDAGLGARLHRALIYYTEETQRANLGIEYDLPHVTRDAFVQAWRQRPHGCRDHRPAHWRRYW